MPDSTNDQWEETEPNLTGTGVLVSGKDVDALVAWYRAALEPLGARWETHMLALPGGTFIGFDRRDDVAERAAEPGRLMINLLVRDVRAAEAHLEGLGVIWIRRPEDVGDGWVFSTLADPDGNYLQLLQPGTA